MQFSSTLPLAVALALCFDADSLVHRAPSADIKKQPSPDARHPGTLPSRREALRRAFLVAPVVAASTTLPLAANALEACKPKSHNCIRTTWTAPSTLKSDEVVGTIRDVLNSYPQEGQAGVDCSGWRIVKDALDSGAGLITLEYKSCVGPAALAINLGQPFIDDLKLELGKDAKGNTTVEVKSSSRMGSGDLFVNRKRLQYLGRKLKEKGWTVPEPKYVYEMKK